MIMKYLNQKLLVGIIAAFIVGGCYYDTVLEPEVSGQVSFSGDIIPIFNTSCNSVGCHSTGGVRPDLSPANAYNALINGGYISTSAPESSELYRWMRGERALPMPLSGPNANYNATVLAWIKQGALNN